MQLGTMEDTLLVFTSQTIDRMARQGGSAAWVIDAKRVRACDYLVCTWNALGEFMQTPETHQHREAFLVAKITSVEPSSDPKDVGRYDIRFTEFARVNIPNVWTKARNPVTYTSLADLKIDPDTLTFEPVNEPTIFELLTRSVAVSNDGPLAISAAKPLIAAYYGVPIDAVEIIIRG